MKYVSLGGRRVSAIGLGAWQLGASEWGWGHGFGPEEARSVVLRALDLGITFFDTAEIYGGGRSEEILGAALLQRDVDVVVATKVWPTRVTASAVLAAARRSLRRLGRPTIDLYQVHWPNPIAPLGWTMAGMRALVESGLVRSVGVSNFSVSRWQRAERLLGQPVVSNQIPYHLLHRRPEHEALPYAASARRTVIAYSPLAQGLFSGAYGPEYRPSGARAWNPLFSRDHLARLQPLTEALATVASKHRVAPAQIALAWVIRGGNVVAIPGARQPWQVEENAAAADIELAPAEVAQIEQSARRVEPPGGHQQLLLVARMVRDRLRARVASLQLRIKN